jgi:hypothetical protein
VVRSQRLLTDGEVVLAGYQGEQLSVAEAGGTALLEALRRLLLRRQFADMHQQPPFCRWYADVCRIIGMSFG